ncbi:CotH kinase family protein [Paenibacillus provencensis]|uniref:CotH kinase family protein n=1 Tax=Paenibacillus provencensis TaxID=441151 RepID=A0ABW3PKC0_9BACL|nr:CotH kinase family protein [Paenibacillus sp. MER 78]MCM3129128.1 CotH kinase family protein [Paenibacillus sp. MER 78]
MALPIYRITIPDKEHEELKADIWSNRFVSGQMNVDHKQLPIRVRYRGGHTREYEKKSYEIRTRSRTYHFNAEFDDPSLIRNALSFRFFESIGVPAPSSLHCHLYLNGEYKGIYLRLEGVKTPFFRKRNLSVQSIFYAINDNAGFSADSVSILHSRGELRGYSMIKGTDADKMRLITFIQKLNTKSKMDLFRYINSRVDVNLYLRWLVGAVLTGNYDGFHQNYTWYENRKLKKYRIIPWDYEGSWGRNCYGNKVDVDLVRIKGYNTLTGKILAYRVFRNEYKKMLKKQLVHSFTKKQIMNLVNPIYQRIEDEVPLDPYFKWPISMFYSEPDTIRNYVEERKEYILEELKSL